MVLYINGVNHPLVGLVYIWPLMNEVFLIVGGNRGDVLETFKSVRNRLEHHLGRLKKQSSIYRTAAWGDEEQPDFLNQVLSYETTMSTVEVLQKCLAIEKQYGRQRDSNNKWAARTIDIDILYRDDQVTESKDLIVPHPRLHIRNFVLTPLAEVAPNFVHPVFHKTSLQLLDECKDKLPVYAL